MGSNIKSAFPIYAYVYGWSGAFVYLRMSLYLGSFCETPKF